MGWDVGDEKMSIDLVVYKVSAPIDHPTPYIHDPKLNGFIFKDLNPIGE